MTSNNTSSSSTAKSYDNCSATEVKNVIEKLMNIPSTSSGESSSIGVEVSSMATSLPSISCVTSKTSDVICKPWRNLVSQNRRRYKKDNFDLDLTYITDRIIAMGFPATDQERIYRNSMEATVAFLERYHAGHYMVFNLRGRHSYNPSHFHNRVKSFEMDDHHPPRLELMAPFCREVHEYLATDDQNVVVVHCKAGKGRTGVMICAYLVYINFYHSPRQNMDYYSMVRTVNNKGVTIPSQRRYVYYFSHLRKRNLNYMPLRSELVGVYFEHLPCLSGLLLDGAFRLRVANGDVDVFIPGPIRLSSKNLEDEKMMWNLHPCGIGDDHYNPYNPEPGKDCISRRCYGWTVPDKKRVFIEGDVRIDLYAKKWFKCLKWTLNREKLGHVWFNTMFTCPDYCGGIYVHGDEAHLHSERETPSPSPPKKSSESNHSEHSPLASHSIVNGMVPSSDQPIDDVNGDSDQKKKTIIKTHCSKNLEHVLNSDVQYPPGLDEHCSSKSLSLIYPEYLGRQPQREEIMKVLRNAHSKNATEDRFNRYLILNNVVGDVIPKSNSERLDCGGPMCLMRRPFEHVLTFGVHEIDRAVKSDKVKKNFQMHVVVRCIDPDNKDDVDLAERSTQSIYEAQAKIDASKIDETRKRNAQLKHHENMSDNTSSFSSNSLNMEAISDQPWRKDSRFKDSHLRRYFFKQQEKSFSVHPPSDYRCSLRSKCDGGQTLVDSSHLVCEDAKVLKINSVEQTPIVEFDIATEDFIATKDKEWLEESSEETFCRAKIDLAFAKLASRWLSSIR